MKPMPETLSSEMSCNTNSMELSSTLEATSCTATQERPSNLWNPTVCYYRITRSPPLVPILSQTNPVHTTSSYLTKIHPNIIHPPMSLSS
jgi:hypothetical protein